MSTDRDPGLYITIRLDHVTRRFPQQAWRDETQTEVLAEATDQRFSPSVMGALLRALAGEVDPNLRERF